MVYARLVLDTSAYSNFKCGDARVLELLSRAEMVYMPCTVIGELYAGFRLGSRYEQNARELQAFIDESYVQAMAISLDVARRYGEVFADLRRAGTPIPTNDIWIAAAALAVGGHVVSFDADFKAIPQLGCTILARG